ASDAYSQAVSRLTMAKAALDKLFEAAETSQNAGKSLKDDQESLDVLTAERGNIQSTVARVQELTNELAIQRTVRDGAAAALGKLADGDQKIALLRQAERTALDALAPLQARTSAAADAEEAAKAKHAAATLTHEAALAAQRETRQHATLAEWYARLALNGSQRAAVEKRMARAEVLNVEMQGIASQLAGLPQVTSAVWNALQKLEQARSVAEAALLATAAGVELLEADVPVVLGNSSIAPGSRTRLTADTILSVGNGVRLRITPGGGASLADAQTAFDDAARSVGERLDELGVSSMDAARAALERRMALVEQQHAVELLLKECGAESASGERAKLLLDAEAAVAEIARRQSMGASHDAPPTSADADARLLEYKQKADDADVAEQRALADMKALSTYVAACGVERQTHAESALEHEVALSACQLDVKVEVGKFGDDELRTSNLASLQADFDACEAEFLGTASALSALQPEDLSREAVRIARAIEMITARRVESEKALAVATHTLTQNGSVDPHADLALAVIQEQHAKARLDRADRHAKAIALLHTLFSQEQENAAAQFSEPLKTAISRYLHCLYGSQSSVSLDYDGSALNQLGLTRNTGSAQGTFSFESLSGGAKEQLGAALRLGVAEVLAAGHDSTLPVVFDDAFAFSDPQRLVPLQRMLDLAAERGLQVIVLTCNPRDYDQFGAKLVTIKAPGVSAISGGASASTDVKVAVPAAASPPIVEARTLPVAVHPRFELPPKEHSQADIADATTEFLATLVERGGQLGNNALRLALGWTEAEYNDIKQHLVLTRKIAIGRGRGGSVTLLD
uniref:ATP-binding protein n=1 Tax=Gemmatimonas sp. TaxID=1962908 RepID=UPI0035660D9B